MQSARGKLKASLKEAGQSEDESETSKASTPRPAKRVKIEHNTENEPVEERIVSRAMTAKKKILVTPATIHQSYVMKLFDRSVDLAKFTDESSLYPICRK